MWNWGRIKALLGALVLVAFLIPANFLFAPAGGDARSYTSHLATAFYDFDLDYSNERAETILFPNGLERPSHPIGSAIVASPVVFIFAVLDVITENDAIANRELYAGSFMSIGWRFASLLSLALSCTLMARLLLALEVPVSRGALLLIFVGSGLGGYFVFQAPEFAHVYSLLTAAALGLCLVRWQGAQSFFARSRFFAASSVVFALSLLVRTENVIFMPLWAASVLLFTRTPVRPKLSFRFKAFIEFCLILAAGFVMYIYANVRFYGIALPLLALRYRQNAISGLVAERTNSGSLEVGLIESLVAEFSIIFPQFVDRIPSLLSSTFGIFLSPEVGALWFAPLIVFALIGPFLLVAVRRSDSDVKLAALLGASVLGGIAISVYWRGSGQGYGLRYLYNIYPIALLGLGRVVRLIDVRKERMAIYSAVGLTWIAFGVVGQFFFDAIPGFYKETVQPAFFNRSSGYVPDFAGQLFRAFASPRTWLIVGAARLPGFVMLLTAPEAVLSKVSSSLLPKGLRYAPSELLQVVDQLPAMQLVFGAAYIAVSIYCFARLLSCSTRQRAIGL